MPRERNFTRKNNDERLFYKYLFLKSLLARLCHFGRRIYVDFITQCIKIESAEF